MYFAIWWEEILMADNFCGNILKEIDFFLVDRNKKDLLVIQSKIQKGANN